MFTPVYRYVRYRYLRRKLRNYLLSKQKKFLDISSDSFVDARTFHFDNTHIEPFRNRYNLSLGETGILLREIVWVDRPLLDTKYGVVAEWLLPLFEYYNDIEVMSIMLSTPKENITNLYNQDEKSLSALIEYMVKKRLYLFAK